MSTDHDKPIILRKGNDEISYNIRDHILNARFGDRRTAKGCSIHHSVNVNVSGLML